MRVRHEPSDFTDVPEMCPPMCDRCPDVRQRARRNWRVNRRMGIVLAVACQDVEVVTEHLRSQGEAVYNLGQVVPSAGDSGKVHWA